MKMYCIIAVRTFQFGAESSISKPEEFWQDISDEGDAMEPSYRKIATLVFGASIEIAPQWKQNRNVCAVKKWRLFAVFFRVYFSWIVKK